MQNKEHFPLFISTTGKNIIVFGGGKIATRRVETLAGFNFKITVIAPNISEKLINMQNVTCINDIYKSEYIKNQFLVLACTNDRIVNNAINLDAKHKNIFVNVADCKEECDFYFPSIIINEHITIGIVGNGNTHTKTKKITDKIREVVSL